MFLSRLPTTNPPNQNSHCFCIVFSRHYAITVLPQGLFHKFVMFVVLVTCFRHVSLLCPSSRFIHYITPSPVSLGTAPLHSFQPLSVHRLPIIQLACIVVRAAFNGRLFFADTQTTLKNKLTHCPCVVRRVA